MKSILTASENYDPDRNCLDGGMICQNLYVNLYAESSIMLQQLQTADAGRDGNHKGFVNIHNQTE